jgi:hypothetical protein
MGPAIDIYEYLYCDLWIHFILALTTSNSSYCMFIVLLLILYLYCAFLLGNGNPKKKNIINFIHSQLMEVEYPIDTRQETIQAIPVAYL